MLKYAPAVFAVGNTYQIMAPVAGHSLFRVKVGEKYFYDEQNGIMCSLRRVHRVSVPQALLDSEKKYTVCERELVDRKPYFPISEPEIETEFSFTPAPRENARIYHVADTHNFVDEPVRAAELFGNIDILIMNGDIPDHSGDVSNFDTIYEIADRITHGNIPIIFARGNHDMRGYHAEEIADYTPSHNGHTYYTARVAGVWALVLDCGEDKADSNEEYGYTVACRPFRERQTEFIREVIENRDREYDAEGVEYKLLICHAPFTYQKKDKKYNSEEEIYREWAGLIKEHIAPDLMISGHMHDLIIAPVGGELDHIGQVCTMIVGSDRSVGDEPPMHAGCGIILSGKKDITVEFCKSTGEHTVHKVEL